MSPEFKLIEKYFTRPVKNAVLGVGDDCALIRVSPGCELAISTDTLASGTHFSSDAEPEKLGHKALAVNLSDLAAMGGTAPICNARHNVAGNRRPLAMRIFAWFFCIGR